MKKTLIALAVAAGTVMSVSGAANAYTPSFSNGDISLGGTVSTPVQAGLYEGKVGTLVGLDATIPVGQTSATITAPTESGLLALRTVQGGFDSSASDKIANITFDGKELLAAASGSSFSGGSIEMTLEARNAEGNRIGDIVFPMQVSGVSVIVDNADASAIGESLYADSNAAVFYGGLPKTKQGAVQNYTDAIGKLTGMFPDIVDNLPSVTSEGTSAAVKGFTATGKTFNAAYAAGINSGETITLNLDNAATSGSVDWTASMPVVVTYK